MTSKLTTDEEDTDLQDLLQDGNPSSPSKDTLNKKYSNYYNAEIEGVNNPKGSSFNILFRIPEVICYYTTHFLLKNPLIGKIGVLAFLGTIIFCLLSLTGKQQSIGVVKYDFSTINTIESRYDFDLGKVDHWCVTGSDECECPDPLTPTPRLHKAWFKAIKNHKALIEQEPNPDIVFIGQTLVEALGARINGHDMSKSQYFGRVKSIFSSKFEVTGVENSEEDVGKSKVKATAMGLTGDHSSNVLWRLIHGELPEGFNPPVWWLVIGLEDVGRYGCSEEITVIGILRIIEEIKKKRPDARIVVNSLLPMIKMRMAEADEEEEFVDAERENGKGPQPKKRRHKGDRIRLLESSEKVEEGVEGTKIARKDAARRKKQLDRMKKKYLEQVKHDKFNPNMKDVKKWKKKGRHSKKGIPMWSAVHVINDELSKFCRRTPGVTFFDVTSIFTLQQDGGKVLSSEMISPRGHPTLEGFRRWLTAISNKVQSYKERVDEDPKSTLNVNGDDYYSDIEEENKKFLDESAGNNDGASEKQTTDQKEELATKESEEGEKDDENE